MASIPHTLRKYLKKIKSKKLAMTHKTKNLSQRSPKIVTSLTQSLEYWSIRKCIRLRSQLNSKWNTKIIMNKISKIKRYGQMNFQSFLLKRKNTSWIKLKGLKATLRWVVLSIKFSKSEENEANKKSSRMTQTGGFPTSTQINSNCPK